MSDENVGGLPDPAAILYPDSGFRRDDHAKALWRTHGYDTGGEPFYSADQLHSHASARVHAAISAHGQPVVDAAMIERALGAANDYWSDPAHEVKCEACGGTGQIACGDEQDYCACGCGFLHAGTDEGAMQAALTAALGGNDRG